MNTDRFKFRVWDNREGYYVGGAMFSDGEVFDYNIFFCFIGENASEPERYIVEQCTGLKDKNGKLIFEGDIVLTVTGAIGEIRHHCCGFKVYFEEMLLYCDVLDDQEIIGNIHEQKGLEG